MGLFDLVVKVATVLSTLQLLVTETSCCEDQCCGETDPVCDVNRKYRTFDGTCTSMYNSNQGKKDAEYARLMEPCYHDGKQEIRKDHKGEDLPNTRTLSRQVHIDKAIDDCKFTCMLYTFAQGCARDCTHQKTPTPGSVKCCSDNNQMLPKDTWPARCDPIEVIGVDPCYSKSYVNVTCISFVRAEASKDKYPLQQLNGCSSVLDLHHIYGIDDKDAASLRKYTEGQLLADIFHGREFPPNSPNAALICQNRPNKTYCMVCGDDRANLNPEMVGMQMLWFKYHNYVAKILAKLNPCWDDEKIYQEARRILIAIWQHITYDKFLPYILGKEFCFEKGLLPNDDCDSCVSYYKCNCNPSTLSEFASSCFRSLHSMVSPEMGLLNRTEFKRYKTIKLKDYFFDPYIFTVNDNYPSLLRALCTQAIRAQDRFVTIALTCNLMKPKNRKWGSDMEALDCMRARDFGVCPYWKIREYCCLSVPGNFDDLVDICTENIELLKANFKDVRDMDLYTAGLLERPAPGAVVGRTFQCIIAKQFQLFKCGDYFYYENCGQACSFTSDQLKEIKKITLSSVICAAGDEVDEIQPDAFRAPDNAGNQRVPCCEIPQICLDAWKEC